LDYIFGRSDKPSGSATYDFAKPGTEANQLLKEVVKVMLEETKTK